MRAFLTLAIAMFASSDSSCAASAPPTFGCPASMGEYHQFDFWIGSWEVRDPSGKVVGHSHIEAISNGCGVSENWQGMTGSNGVSYNAWDTSTVHWHQFWIGNNSPNGVLASRRWHRPRQEMAACLAGNAAKPWRKTGKPQIQRITWTPNADGSVRQLWDQSDDGGKNWTVSFDGTYRKDAK